MRYAELAQALALAREPRRACARWRDTVRALRASKSMVLDPQRRELPQRGLVLHESRSCRGAEAERVKARAVARGLVTRAEDVPCYDAAPGPTEARGGLADRARGHAQGPAPRSRSACSSKHALALVHHGGGSTGELLALADEMRARVREAFGVALEIEPVRWG